MRIAEDLDLDVARILDELLDEDAIVAKAVQALALGRLEALAHVLFAIGEPHALAAAARARLHHNGVADVIGYLDCMVGIANFADEAGDDVHSRFARDLLGLDLVAHRGDRLGRRTDEGNVLFRQRLDEARAL